MGQNRGRWSKICCLRETGYYLNRAGAIGGVWEKGMRLRSAVWLGQLLSWGLFKLICTARCSGEIGQERDTFCFVQSLCVIHIKNRGQRRGVWEGVCIMQWVCNKRHFRKSDAEKWSLDKRREKATEKTSWLQTLHMQEDSRFAVLLRMLSMCTVC